MAVGSSMVDATSAAARLFLGKMRLALLALVMNAKNRKRPADTCPARSAPVPIEMNSATSLTPRAPPYRPVRPPFFDRARNSLDSTPRLCRETFDVPHRSADALLRRGRERRRVFDQVDTSGGKLAGLSRPGGQRYNRLMLAAARNCSAQPMVKTPQVLALHGFERALLFCVSIFWLRKR